MLAAFAVRRSRRRSTAPRVTLREARLLPAPVQTPIPVWVGGKGGPRLLRLAARHAAGWNARVALDALGTTRHAPPRRGMRASVRAGIPPRSDSRWGSTG